MDHAITQFVAACCRWSHSDDTRGHVARAAAEVDDWDVAQEVATRHRVIPLVHLAVKDLADVPEGFRAWAKQKSQETALHAMKLAHECIALDAAFKAAGLAPLHIKGPVLAQIAYGSVAMKHSRDLDIFVAAPDIRAAVLVLEAAGYRVNGGDTLATKRQIEATIRNAKDLAFIGPNGTLVELHWKFTHTQDLLTGLEDNLSRQSVLVANNATLDTFDAPQMVRYLCVHGAMHHWVRLKWLADLCAFLDQLCVQERDHAIAQVRSGPSRDALEQALALCDTLFDTTYAPDLSPSAQALYDYALARIRQSYSTPKSFWGDVWFLRDVMAIRHLYPKPWRAIWALKTHLVSKVDVFAIPLPRYLNGVYPIIRLPSFLIRRIRG